MAFYLGKRTKNIFDPNSKEPFPLSRTKLERFLQCPRCFYLDRRLGVDQVSGPPWSLNVAVDTLLKKEFDIHRVNNTRHPLMEAYGIDALPFQHKNIEQWRDARGGGIFYLHKPTNFLFSGGIDDVWENANKELHVVDYKATSKNGAVNIDAPWQVAYKRQIEIYQWLFRQNGFKVSDTGYFVYVNGKTDKEAFDGKLEFDVVVIPYKGSDDWVEAALIDARQCLLSEKLPQAGADCDFCLYRNTVREALLPFKKQK